MEQWTEVRRAVLVDGISKREACRRFGIHWQTLQRMLAHPAPPGYQRTAKVDRPVIGPWLGRLAELLEANRELPRKQRYTVTRMWDVLTGEGFTGGYIPLAATVTTPKVADVFRKKPGSELRSGSTYGGHTIACAATLANIEIIEKHKLVPKAARMGRYLKKELDKLCRHSIVGDVRGVGLLWAVELMADRRKGTPLPADLGVGSWIRDYCYQRGMILRNNGDILVTAPALVITQEQIDEMVAMIDQSIAAAVKHFRLGKKTGKRR